MYCTRCGAINRDDAAYCTKCGNGLNPGAPPAPSIVGTGLQYSGFWRRFGASYIDGMILGTPINVVSSMVINIVIQDAILNRDLTYLLVLFGAYVAILYVYYLFAGWIYFGLMTSSSKQASVGKMTLGIIVTDINGGRLSFARSSARYFATYISDMTLGIGYLMIIWTKKKQSLHDMVAGTLVVRKR